MGEIVLAIVLGVTMTLTGCTKAGESTVSDYEQGGYFQEEQQQEKKEVDKPKATTPQPTKSASEQPTERKQDNIRIINQQQNNKSTEGADKVKKNSNNKKEYNHKQDNQSTDNTNNYPTPGTPPTEEDTPDVVCGICGGQVYRGEGIVVKNFPGDGDEEGSVVVSSGAIVHKSCYHRVFDDDSHYKRDF